jgi:hypothetical protein
MAGSIKIEQFSEYNHQKWLDLAIDEGMEFEKDELPFAMRLVVVEGKTPFGIVRVLENTEYFEPHASIFPWASPRQVYQGFIEILNLLKTMKNVLVITRDINKACYDRWAKHGFCRYVGTLEKLSHGNSHIYQVAYAGI